DEAYEPEIGWQIGRGEEYANPETADDIESRALYDMLENQIIPMFYDRDEFGVPREWVAWMKKSIATLAPLFNTNRMVQDYAEKLYVPAIRRARMLGADGLANSVQLAHMKDRLRADWGALRIDEVHAPTAKPLGVHDSLDISVVANLTELRPDEVRVQACVGLMDNDGKLVTTQVHELAHAADLGDGR